MVDGIEVRPVADAADRGRFAGLWNEVFPCNPYSADEFAHGWDAAPASVALLAFRDGHVVGVGHAETQHWAPDATTAIAVVAVSGSSRGAGIGTVLADVLGEWAGAQGCDGLEVFTMYAPDGAAGFWKARGFDEIFREVVRQLALRTAVLPSARVPEGITFVSQRDRPDLDQAVYAVGCEAIADSPGGEGDRYDAGDLAHWVANEYRAPGVIPECTVVALDVDGTPVGYASLGRMEALPGTGMHGFTGVARDWRGRGVATALKLEQIARARAYGLMALRTENVSHNAAMIAINDRLGYEEIYQVSVLRGPLTPTG
jgi:GNAT superfamily N-acetyltransferase